MRQPVTSLLVAGLLLGSMLAPATAAEREQVRIVVNLMAAVKMPYPENLARNRARTQRVWLEHLGAATVACIRLETRRWCYEHIAPVGARAEMLRIRDEAPGLSVGALFHYVDDFDLDGMIDVGSTTRIEGSERGRAGAGADTNRQRHPVLPPRHQPGPAVSGRLPENVR